MLNAILSIAVGGAAGSVARYGVNVASGKMFGMDFPYGTLIVNVVGSFVIGALIAIFAQIWQPSENIRLFLVTGFLGGFTTFSSFSLDFANLWQRGDYVASAAYLSASIVLSIVALFAAMALVKEFAS
jgi:CrcB protein